jgi:hypothetical protein
MGSSVTEVIAADMRAPSGTGAPTQAQRLAGTGGTGVENATALTLKEMATLLNGPVPIRFAFGPTAAVEAAVTDPILGPYGRLDWVVSARDVFVSIEAADGVAQFEAHVWTSSGPRAGE